MAIMDLKSSWPKLLFAGLIAVVPAVLSYCKSSQEADHARIEADAGYKALVQSVRHLELVVAAQSNAIGLLTNTRIDVGAGAGSADPAAGSAAAGSGSAEPVAVPSFPELPDSTAAALRMQSENRM
jgi:hypothetical protein